MNFSKLKTGEKIIIGNNYDAVISSINKTDQLVEVVYRQNGNKAIYDDVKWEDGQWKFVNPGPSGGYADRVPRLAKFIKILDNIG